MRDDWKAELDALIADSMAFVQTIKVDVEQPRARPREDVERIGLIPIDLGDGEREEIRKRVENFRRHQERFIREREAFAASLLSKTRSAFRPR